MKVLRNYLTVALGVFIVAGSAYAQSYCDNLKQLIKEQQDLKDQATASRAQAWKNYTIYCGAGSATSTHDEPGGKGKGNMCAYYSGGEFRWVYKKNTVPVTDCDGLSCFDGSLIGYVFGSLDALFSYTGLDQITDMIAVDQTLTANCKTYCHEWHTYNAAIPDYDKAVTGLIGNEATLCPSPCTGKQGDDLNKCECERKDRAFWSWDAVKKQCVACKSKEGQGDEYEKCLCEKVNEGLWDATEKNCYGKSCAGKAGDDYKKCICEVEKKGVWHSVKKVCNYTPGAPKPGGGSLTGGDIAVSETGSGPGYTSEGAAVGSASESGSTSSIGSQDLGGFGEPGLAGGGAKDKKDGKASAKSSWYSNLLGAIGLGGSSPQYYGTSEGGGSASSIKTSTEKDNKQQAVRPSDIAASNSPEGPFEITTKILTASFRSGIIGEPGTTPAK